MKIIDLLNDIAEGKEVPKKIKYDNRIYEYQDNYHDYLYYVENNGTMLFLFTKLFESDVDIFDILTYEVEIIEDTPKVIEKFQILDNQISGKFENGSPYIYTLSAPQKVIAEKLLEVIEVVNNLDK